METQAPKRLLQVIAAFLEAHNGAPPRLLNVGAGKSFMIESHLVNRRYRFVCDRVDVEDCEVVHPNVGRCYRCALESMGPVKSGVYDLVFANYVLEHVEGLTEASREVCRVLRPGAMFIATVPNPTAPEFLIAKRTPLWLHRMIRGGTGWETHYSYKSVPHLVDILRGTGLQTIEVAYYACVETYMGRFPVLGRTSSSL